MFSGIQTIGIPYEVASLLSFRIQCSIILVWNSYYEPFFHIITRICQKINNHYVIHDLNFANKFSILTAMGTLLYSTSLQGWCVYLSCLVASKVTRLFEASHNISLWSAYDRSEVSHASTWYSNSRWRYYIYLNHNLNITSFWGTNDLLDE